MNQGLVVAGAALVIFAAFDLLALYAACRVSGAISRKEESGAMPSPHTDEVGLGRRTE